MSGAAIDWDAVVERLGTPTTPTGAVAPQRPMAASPPAIDWDAAVRRTQRQNVDRALTAAFDGPEPDQAAEALRIAGETGVPADVVRRDLTSLRRRAERLRFDTDSLVDKSPATAAFLADPENARIARDDVGALTRLEGVLTRTAGDVGSQFRGGMEDDELGRLGFRLLKGDSLDSDAMARFVELEATRGRQAETWPGSAARMAGTMVPGLGKGVERGLQTGMAFGGGAALLGQAGPQAGLPEELVTVPAATAAGFGVGMMAGTAEESVIVNSGLAFTEFRRITDTAGNRIDPAAARVAATVVGGLSGGLDAVGIGYLLSKFPGLSQLGAAGQRQLVAQLLRRPGVAAALASAARGYAGGIAVETSTEVLQEAAQILGGELLKVASPGEFEAMSGEEMLGRLASTAAETAKGMSLLALPGPSASLVVDLGRARTAGENQQFFQALGEAAESSRLRERLPERFQQLVEQATRDGPVREVFVPAEAFATYFQEQGVDPAAVAGELGIGDQLARAREVGGDLVIPIDAYAARLAGSQFHQELSRHMRLRPGDMTLAEAEAFKADMAAELEAEVRRSLEGDAGQQNDGPAARVFDDVRRQLIEAGRTPEVADREAAVFRAVFATLGERAGIDPWELYRRQGLQLRRSLPESVAGLSDEELDRLLGRAGDAGTQGPSGTADAPASDPVAPADAARKPSADGQAFLPDGSAIDVGYELVELADLLASHRDDLSADPAFPEALQPRDRGRAASGEQIARMAGRLIPELLGQSANAADGAPIVGPDGVVESGNGRVMALRRAYGQDMESAARYRAWLESQGYDVSGMTAPVLVRRRRTELDDDGRAAFARAANARTTASMSAAEQALADAAALTPEILGLLRSNDIAAAANRPFARAFLAQVAAPSELGGFVTEAGELSLDGRRRIRGALLAKAYGDMALVERLLEEDEGGLGPLGRALLDVAPRWAALADPDATAALVDATRAVLRQRDSGDPLHFPLQQAEMFGAGLSPDARAFLSAFLVMDRKGNSRLAGRDRLAATLQAFLGEAEKRGQGPGLTGEAPSTTAEILAALAGSEQRQLQKLVEELGLDPATATAAELRAATSQADATGALFQRVPAPDWFTNWLGLSRDRIDANYDGLYRKYLAQASEPERARFQSADDVRRYVEETIANAHIAIEATSDSAVLVARIGDREQAVIVENKGPQGGIVISTFGPRPGQLDSKIADIVERARRRDAVPAILLSPAAASDPDVRLLVSRWLPLPLDRVQPGAYDLSSGRFLGKGKALFQGTPKGARGAISFLPDGRTLIQLFEQANLSTVLHESGHLFLEVLRQVATAEGAPEALRHDWQTVLDWLGVGGEAAVGQSGAAGAGGGSAIGRDQHEQWARGFEAYLMEGKAPSLALQSVFDRFRAWLTRIYRTLKGLDVELSDEIRRVFDRLLASDQEIDTAEAASRFAPLLNDPAAAGMTPAEHAAYLASAEKATAEAKRTLVARAMADIRRERTAAWKADAAATAAEVEAELDQRPVYRALRYFETGELPGLADMPDELRSLRIDRAALVETSGQDVADRLEKAHPSAIADLASKPAHPDHLAELLGFDSGDAMAQQLAEAPPRAEVAKAEVARRMRERHGDMLEPGRIAEAAIEAVHGDARAEFLSLELAALARRAGMGGTPTPLAVIRDSAARFVAESKVGTVTRHDHHLHASQRFGRAAQQAVAKGDFRAATEAKRRQLFHFAAFQEARKAAREVEKALERFARLSRPETVRKLPAAYNEQIAALLARFDLRRSIPAKVTRERQALADWIRQQEEAGLQIDIPDQLRNEAFRQPYRELTVEDFRGLRDAVLQLEHLARQDGQLLAAQRQASLEEAAAEIVASIEANNEIKPDEPDFAPGRFDEALDRLRSWDAWLTKMEFLFERLDGHKHGPVWRLLFKPLADAEAVEETRAAETSRELRRIYGAYSAAERSRLHKTKIFVPAIGKSFTKDSLLAMALNWGNEGNRKALMEGYGWTAAQVEAALSRLDKRDWDTVQAIWDLNESFWPDIQALQRDMAGRAPDKVQATPIHTAYGVYRGGYYPLKYDPKRSHLAFQREEKQQVQELFGGNWSRAATRQGHTKARVGSAGQPVLLDTQVLGTHLRNVLHDLTHRRAVIDATKLAEHPDVRAAIEAAVGRDLYRKIKPWLTNIASGPPNMADESSGTLAKVRTGTTVANMGLKLSVALQQVTGWATTLHELGPRYAFSGLAQFYADPMRAQENLKFIFERSPAMRFRRQSFDRDVADTIRRLTRDGMMSPVRASFFWLTGMLDMAVAVPTWLGAYGKGVALHPGDDAAAAAYADSVVRMTQSAGGPKDLSAIQTGSETWKIFTMFYSFLNVQYNLLAREGRIFKWRDPATYPRMISAVMFLVVAPAILPALMLFRGPDDDEDWLKWAAKESLLLPLQTVPILRDVVAFAKGGSQSFELSPVAGAFRAAADTVVNLTEGDGWTRGEVRQASYAAGVWWGLPERQMWITGEGIYDLVTGDWQPESPGELFRHLFLQRRPADARP